MGTNNTSMNKIWHRYKKPNINNNPTKTIKVTASTNTKENKQKNQQE